MAWRNLWRSRRRTLITVASVFFAVFFALLMRSLQLGAYDHMFRNAIESYTGYIQIQNEDFWDDKIVDNTFAFTGDLEKRVSACNNILATVPRFESFALANSGNLTKGVLVMGIDPEKEKYLSNVKNRLVRFRLSDSAIAVLSRSGMPVDLKKRLVLLRGNSYSSPASLLSDLGVSDNDSSVILPFFRKYASFSNAYISNGEKGVLAGDRLAKFLGIGRGDTIVLLGQGYHGTTASGKYVVKGIVKLPSPDLDNKILYLPYDVCQDLFNAPGMLTSLAVSVRKNDDDDIRRLMNDLSSEIAPPLKVMGWREMNKLMINQMDADNKSGGVMVLILYLVIAFGIFGTVLMMTSERKREFGILVAIGMRKTRLAAIFVTEMCYIGLLGIIAGIISALPVIYYGHAHPLRFHGQMAKMYEDYGLEAVMPFLLPGGYLIWQSVVVAVIVFIALIYPLRKISRMVVVNALKS